MHSELLRTLTLTGTHLQLSIALFSTPVAWSLELLVSSPLFSALLLSAKVCLIFSLSRDMTALGRSEFTSVLWLSSHKLTVAFVLCSSCTFDSFVCSRLSCEFWRRAAWWGQHPSAQPGTFVSLAFCFLCQDGVNTCFKMMLDDSCVCWGGGLKMGLQREGFTCSNLFFNVCLFSVT